MKKWIAILLSLVMVLALAACTSEAGTDETDAAVEGMTHEEYAAAAVDEAVTVVTYVQAHQSWWDDKITVYCQSPDGAYFVYDMACSEEDAAKLDAGTCICVTGYKSEWSGEVEITDATFEFVDADPYVAEAVDLTELLGTDELIDHQNEYATLTGLTVVSLSYKESESDPDIYLTVSYGDTNYDLCVENYLTGPDTEVYQAVAGLQEGDVISATGYLYWYNGLNMHITGVTTAAAE